MEDDAEVLTAVDPPIDEHSDDGTGPSTNNDNNDHAPTDDNVIKTTADESEDTGEHPVDLKHDIITDNTHVASSDQPPEMPYNDNEANSTEKSTAPSAPNDCFKQTDSITTTLTKRNTKQYEYIKHGSRIKALISAAFKAVSYGFSNDSTTVEHHRGKKRNADEPEDENVVDSKRARGLNEIHAQDLARDRMEECVNLKLVRSKQTYFRFAASILVWLIPIQHHLLNIQHTNIENTRAAIPKPSPPTRKLRLSSNIQSTPIQN